MPANTKPATVSATDLGFGEVFDLGSYYLTEDEKNAAIASGAEFYITGIDYDTKNKFGERFILALQLASETDGDTRGWAIAATDQKGVVTNAKRNEILEAIMVKMSVEKIAKIGPIVFVRRGRTVMFQPAESKGQLPASDPAPVRENEASDDSLEDLPF